MTPTLAATLALGLLAAGYAAACWARPFGRCHYCSGHGYRTTRFLRRVRPCRHCKGAGLRLRHGRRAANTLRRVYSGLR